jgi:hypothetical protein
MLHNIQLIVNILCKKLKSIMATLTGVCIDESLTSCKIGFIHLIVYPGANTKNMW